MTVSGPDGPADFEHPSRRGKAEGLYPAIHARLPF